MQTVDAQPWTSAGPIHPANGQPGKRDVLIIYYMLDYRMLLATWV